MDKDKQSSYGNSIYPQATRGTLANQQVHKTYTSGPISRVRDSSPAATITKAVIMFFLLVAIVVGGIVFLYGRTHKIDPTVVSFKIADRVSELKTTQSTSELELIADQAIKNCSNEHPPVITITHEYNQVDQPSRIDTSVIRTGEIKDIKAVLDGIDNKARGARLNTMSAACS